MAHSTQTSLFAHDTAVRILRGGNLPRHPASGSDRFLNFGWKLPFFDAKSLGREIFLSESYFTEKLFGELEREKVFFWQPSAR